MNAQWREAWVEALDALEMDVAAAEAILSDAHRVADAPATDPWRPPAGLGPLPLDLRPRADAILARQLAAAEAITCALAATRKQAVLANRLRSHQAPTPAYVDCAM